MENKTFEMVRAPVALAIVKLLLRLPPQVLHLEFPRLLTVLCNQVCVHLYVCAMEACSDECVYQYGVLMFSSVFLL
jgi:hypothetical protein